MKLGVVTGTVTATAKDAQLVGSKLLLTDVIDAAGKVLIPATVAIDTVGAGVGDRVLLAEGSAARLAANVSALPVDASIIAVVDDVAVAQTKKLTKRISRN